MAKKSKAPLGDLADFLHTPQPLHKPCVTCTEASQDVLDACTQYVASGKAGKLQVAFAAFYRWVRAHTDYTLGSDALRKHIRRCLSFERTK